MTHRGRWVTVVGLVLLSIGSTRAGLADSSQTTPQQIPGTGPNTKVARPGKLDGAIWFDKPIINAAQVCPTIRVTASLAEPGQRGSQPTSWSTTPEGHSSLGNFGKATAWCSFSFSLPPGGSVRIQASVNPPMPTPVPSPQTIKLNPGQTSTLKMTVHNN